MRWHQALLSCVVLSGVVMQLGCSGGKPAGDTVKQGEQSFKAAAPPGMSEQTDMAKMYQNGGAGGAGQGMDASKMAPKYPAGYPGMGGGGAPRGAQP